MTEIFSQRDTLVLGEKHSLKWPVCDTECHLLIEHDLNKHFPEILRLVPGRRNCVQAGGNCGMYPLAFSKTFQRVFTFEPDPVNFHCLAHNCTSQKIFKFNAGLGQEAKFTGLNVQRRQNVGMHQVTLDGGIEIVVMPLDALRLSEVDFIQLDIEGYELAALLGARDTLQRCKPVLCLEISQKRAEIEQLVTEFGYRHVNSWVADNVYVPN